MSKAFGVSRMTVRQALETLKEERYISTRKGYGSIIKNRPKQVSADLSKLESIEAMIRSSGKKLGELSRTIETGELNRKEANLLFCEEGTPFKRLVRLRTLDEIPVAVTINIFKESQAPADLETFSGSLLSLLEKKGTPIDYAETTIIIPRAGDRYADVLRESHTGLPIGICQQVHFNWAHQPIFLSYDYLNLNVFSLTVTRKKM